MDGNDANGGVNGADPNGPNDPNDGADAVPTPGGEGGEGGEGGAIESAVRAVDGSCPVCMEEKHLLALPCGHSFCDECLRAWLPNLRFESGTCPVCRSTLALRGAFGSGRSGGALGVLAIGEDAQPSEVFVATYPRTVWQNVASFVPQCEVPELLPRLLDFLPNTDEIGFFDEDRFCLIIFTVRQFCPLLRRRSVRQAGKQGPPHGAREEWQRVQKYKAQFRWEGDSSTWLEIVNDEEEVIMGACVNSLEFVRSMMNQSQHGLAVSDTVGRQAVLRTVHDGMGVGVFDARRRVLTEVWHASIGTAG